MGIDWADDIKEILYTTKVIREIRKVNQQPCSCQKPLPYNMA